jgi:hypothetical protein
MTTRSVLVLGSTGSIGTQALDVVAAHPDRFMDGFTVDRRCGSFDQFTGTFIGQSGIIAENTGDVVHIGFGFGDGFSRVERFKPCQFGFMFFDFVCNDK